MYFKQFSGDKETFWRNLHPRSSVNTSDIFFFLKMAPIAPIGSQLAMTGSVIAKRLSADWNDSGHLSPQTSTEIESLVS